MAIWFIPSKKQWAARFRDGKGGRPYREFDREKDAKRWHDDNLRAVRDGKYVPPKEEPTFRESAEAWLATKAGHATATYDQFRTHLERHLNPRVGDRKIAQLTATQVEQLVIAPLTGALGGRTLAKVLTTGAAVFTHATRDRAGLSNPFRLAVRPRQEGDDQDAFEVSPEQAYTPEQLGKILRKAEDGEPLAFLMTAAFTGLRHGELMGLLWEDIDLDARTLTVRRSVTWARRPDGTKGFTFKAPKTKSGRRTIPGLPQALIAVLRKWKLQSAPLRLPEEVSRGLIAKKLARSAERLVFPNEAGLPLQRNAGLRWLSEAAGRAEVDVLDVKALRHTFASISISVNRLSIPEVQRLMGHGNPGVTAKIYTHWVKDAESTASAQLADVVLGGRE